MTADPARLLRQRALALLARREHSRAELAAKLGGGDRGEPAADVTALLQSLETEGLLSDVRAADAIVRARRGRFGTVRIVHELREKGIAPDVMAPHVDLLREGEKLAAREVWEKKFGRSPADLAERARQTRFLQGRGFSLAAIIAVLGAHPGETE